MYTMTDEIMTQVKTHNFSEGVIYALEYLSTLYDGVQDTDIWAEYMTGDNK